MSMTLALSLGITNQLGGGGGGAQTIGGVAIGAAGTVGTLYEGYTLSDGDEFTTLDLVGPATPRGKYFPTRTYGAGARGSDGALGTMFDTDPLFTGYNDSNRGVPVGYSNMSLSSSVLTLQSRKATAGEQTHMQSVRNEVSAMISGAGAMYWYPGVAGTEDIIFEARVRMSASAGDPAGWHPTVWVQSLTPVQPIESDEFDHEGTSLGCKFNKNLWTAGSTTASSSGTRVDHDGAWHTISFIFNKTNARRYIDGTLNGTLTGGNDKDKPQYPIISSHIFNPTFDGDTYSAAAWNADADGAQIDVDWIRVWSRTGKPSFAPLTSISDVNVDYGSSTTFTLPSALTIWGDASVTEYLQVVYNEENEPGVTHAAIYSQFPTGVSYNTSTREVTVNITSGKTGRLNFVLAGWKNGSAGRPLRFAVNVGPNPTVPDLSILSAGQVTSIDVYAQQDCGVLTTNGVSKAKTISVTGLTGSGLSYNDTTGLLTGTAVAGTYTVGITVTNSLGQSKSASGSKTIASSFNPATEAKVIEWWDANDNTKVFSDAAATTQAVAGSTDVQAFVGKKVGANCANSVSAQTPAYVTDANGKKAVKFTTANNDYLFTNNATVVGEASGDDNAFTIIAALKRGTPGVTAMPLTFSPDTSNVANYIRTSLNSSNTVGFGRQNAGTLTQASSAGAPLTADQWYTIAWIFEGTTVTIRVDGVVVLSAAAMNSAPVTVDRFSLGGRYDDQLNVYTSTVAFGGAFGEILLMSGISASDGVIGVAETYLMAKWTN